MAQQNEEMGRMLRILETKVSLLKLGLYLDGRLQRIINRQESRVDLLLSKPKNAGSVTNQILSIALFVPELKSDCEQLVIRYLSEKERNYYYQFSKNQ